MIDKTFVNGLPDETGIYVGYDGYPIRGARPKVIQVHAFHDWDDSVEYTVHGYLDGGEHRPWRIRSCAESENLVWCHRKLTREEQCLLTLAWGDVFGEVG